MIMKRRLYTVIVLLLTLSSYMYAKSSLWFAPYPAAFNVDLSDSYTYCGISSTTNLNNIEFRVTDGYNDTTLVALFGVTETDGTTYVTFSFPEGENAFKYISASQPTSTREYSIYLVERRRYEYTGIAWSTHTVDVTWSCTSLSENVSEKQYEFAPTNKTERKWFDHAGLFGSGDYGYLIGCWVDVVLVLPPIEEGRAISPASDYSSYFDVTLSGAISGDYHCEFTGFYQADPGTSRSSVLFNVVPDIVNANSIMLSSDNVDIMPDGNGLEIGRYSYATTIDYQFKGDPNNQYYIFASSSPSPVVQGNKFELRLQGTDTSISNNRITIPYTVTLKTDEREDRKVVFYGDDCVDGNMLSKGLESLGDPGGMSQIEGDSNVYLYYDNGSILFNLASSEIDNLISGVYESTVYFHVVSLY